MNSIFPGSWSILDDWYVVHIIYETHEMAFIDKTTRDEVARVSLIDTEKELPETFLRYLYDRVVDPLRDAVDNVIDNTKSKLWEGF